MRMNAQPNPSAFYERGTHLVTYKILRRYSSLRLQASPVAYPRTPRIRPVILPGPKRTAD